MWEPTVWIKGRHCSRESELMGFLPWWENEVKNEITMNGLEKAKERWRVLCEMFMDEDW